MMQGWMNWMLGGNVKAAVGVQLLSLFGLARKCVFDFLVFVVSNWLDLFA